MVAEALVELLSREDPSLSREEARQFLGLEGSPRELVLWKPDARVEGSKRVSVVRDLFVPAAKEGAEVPSFPVSVAMEARPGDRQPSRPIPRQRPTPEALFPRRKADEHQRLQALEAAAMLLGGRLVVSDDLATDFILSLIEEVTAGFGPDDIIRLDFGSFRRARRFMRLYQDRNPSGPSFRELYQDEARLEVRRR